MERTVRFRLTDDDLEKLRDIADGRALSHVLRQLIDESHRRKHRK